MNGREFYERAIPILCYHSTPDRGSFAMQMECLREAGWSVIGVRDLTEWMAKRILLPLPAVVITFDDCYRNQFLNAVPVLVEQEYTATFFAVSEWVDKRGEGNPLDAVGKLPLMGREELLELRRLGFEVGCHTRTHRNLPGLESEEQKTEIESGKRELEKILGEQIRFFCYPYGQYTGESLELVRECGFSAAFCTKVGAVQQGDDFFTLKRVCVPVSPSREEFQAQLTWIPQIAEMVHRVPHLDRVARVLWSSS